ncbi:hypothetical protein SAMN05216223_103173 [Actinacidiphila yanglinensis]|uniref:Cell wall-associated hydrolase, NlpC family n=1 Tax=Actinacidiphila yanglinensis TaxID=310779 RepID=A0A1H5XA91_9ACTN|nr:peptidoglycan-binding protein [Actinacidiphila yanglinensis]SEG08668.1 hypothetical protein SAMN05216223_103173 [Actinacidiphila yanglinensis]
MSLPVFEDVEPLPSCGCEDCARRRLAAAARAAAAAGPAGPARPAARAVVAAAAAGTALAGAAVWAAPAAQADGAGTSDAAAAPMTLTRAQILDRAETWVAAKVPYSMTSYWKDGYRQDCSGFVSMAWGLNTNAWTGDLAGYAVPVTKDELQPGDALLFDNADDPVEGSHVVLFGGWVDDAHTAYTGYEQTMPNTQVQTIPYAYWSNSAKYLPYRDKYLAGADSTAAKAAPSQNAPSGGSGPEGSTAAFPGRGAFGRGAQGAEVTRLGMLLVGRGAGGAYRVGPGPRWGRADTEATAAFQRAQGWSGTDADGLPGPATWSYLVHHRGKDVAAPPAARSAPAGQDAPVPPYPGAGAFRPGSSSTDVLALGARLVAKGFGAHYRVGPGRIWSEADRRNVEAFQRAQGWSARDADGHPGPETWRRLFT